MADADRYSSDGDDDIEMSSPPDTQPESGKSVRNAPNNHSKYVPSKSRFNHNANPNNSKSTHNHSNNHNKGTTQDYRFSRPPHNNHGANHSANHSNYHNNNGDSGSRREPKRETKNNHRHTSRGHHNNGNRQRNNDYHNNHSNPNNHTDPNQRGKRIDHSYSFNGGGYNNGDTQSRSHDTDRSHNSHHRRKGNNHNDRYRKQRSTQQRPNGSQTTHFSCESPAAAPYSTKEKIRGNRGRDIDITDNSTSHANGVQYSTPSLPYAQNLNSTSTSTATQSPVLTTAVASDTTSKTKLTTNVIPHNNDGKAEKRDSKESRITFLHEKLSGLNQEINALETQLMCKKSEHSAAQDELNTLLDEGSVAGNRGARQKRRPDPPMRRQRSQASSIGEGSDNDSNGIAPVAAAVDDRKQQEEQDAALARALQQREVSGQRRSSPHSHRQPVDREYIEAMLEMRAAQDDLDDLDSDSDVVRRVGFGGSGLFPDVFRYGNSVYDMSGGQSLASRRRGGRRNNIDDPFLFLPSGMGSGMEHILMRFGSGNMAAMGGAVPWGNGIDFENYDQLSELFPNVQRGADSHQINRLPTSVFATERQSSTESSNHSHSESNNDSSHTNSNTNADANTDANSDSNANSNAKTLSDNQKCCICLEPFKNGDTIKRLPCLHIFHHDEIDNWLSRSKKCPICRMSIDNNGVPPST